ncbi:MAG: cytochrome C [Candidatus Latescibacteria bacterium]|nr:cytochrome C [Candidatus Latescibacterota bacterium]
MYLSRIAAAVALCGLLAHTAHAAPADQAKPADPESIERGHYLVKITGCNDCHTAGYTQTDGQTPEKDWLTGDLLGWQGPWGTTYASNLRLYMQEITEDQWVGIAHNARFRPPMPWYSLHAMSETDLRAIYRFIHSLGPAGTLAPTYLPPGQVPQGPRVTFPEPQ